MGNRQISPTRHAFFKIQFVPTQWSQTNVELYVDDVSYVDHIEGQPLTNNSLIFLVFERLTWPHC